MEGRDEFAECWGDLGRPHPVPAWTACSGQARRKDGDEVTLPSSHSHTHLPQSRVNGCPALTPCVLLTRF